MTEWCIKNRGMGKQPPLVLLPGWGFTGGVLVDHPTFAKETLIASMGMTSPDMLPGLVGFLNSNQINKVRILGWSMGGNLALDFARQYPAYIASLILVSVRRHWPIDEIEFTRKGLFDKTGQSMEKFYRKCFLGARADYKQFTALFKLYADHRNIALLDEGLTYLTTYTMPEKLPVYSRIIQGEKDVICPADEMIRFSSTPETTMLAGAGHFLFSHPDFKI